MTVGGPRTVGVVALLALGWADAAAAHTSGAEAARDAGDAVLVVILLAGALALYLLGLRRLWSQAGRGRGVEHAAALAFVLGLAALAAALLPPVHALGRRSFAMHMVEHELLMAVAAPLLVLGRPVAAFMWALPPAQRRGAAAIAAAPRLRRAARFLSGGLVAFILHALALWAWHVPALFERAMASAALHALQHASFLAAALLYWSSLLARGRGGAAVLSLFATSLATGLLGALLTLGTVPWYPAYGGAPSPWGLSPLEDQQLAGLLMWVPGGVVYLGAALLLLWRWLRDAEAGVRRWEARRA
jgi:cytochrome c oxidase assembly factor CtaG